MRKGKKYSGNNTRALKAPCMLISQGGGSRQSSKFRELCQRLQCGGEKYFSPEK